MAKCEKFANCNERKFDAAGYYARQGWPAGSHGPTYIGYNTVAHQPAGDGSPDVTIVRTSNIAVGTDFFADVHWASPAQKALAKEWRLGVMLYCPGPPEVDDWFAFAETQGRDIRAICRQDYDASTRDWWMQVFDRRQLECQYEESFWGHQRVYVHPSYIYLGVMNSKVVFRLRTGKKWRYSFSVNELVGE